MKFEFTDDEKFFRDLLKDDFDKELFDFRDPVVKRNEFNVNRDTLLALLISERGTTCQLQLVDQCSDTMEIDHFIPLSSNELNKKLRHMKPINGKKVPTQSFGSNHPNNLLIACAACNAHKKHRFITKDKKLFQF